MASPLLGSVGVVGVAVVVESVGNEVGSAVVDEVGSTVVVGVTGTVEVGGCMVGVGTLVVGVGTLVVEGCTVAVAGCTVGATELSELRWAPAEEKLTTATTTNTSHLQVGLMTPRFLRKTVPLNLSNSHNNCQVKKWRW